MAEQQRLRFVNGKFTILHITDTQEIPEISSDTVKLYDALLNESQPQLVVSTGDQIKGHSKKFRVKGKDTKQLVKDTITKLFLPITNRNIPFAVTFGNHDKQSGVSNAEQMEYYRELPTFFTPEHEYGPGTYVLPIYDSAGERPVFLLYLIDSGGDAQDGGYDAVDEKIIQWYRDVRDGYAENNGGKPLPAIVFQHIPLMEYYRVLKQVKRGTRHAVRAFRVHKNELYVLPDGPGASANDFFREPPSIPDENTGAYLAYTEKGDVLAVFVGHDHGNSFERQLGNIMLGYTQSSGFNEYGPGVLRGGRVFELDEDNPHSYRTRTHTYKGFFGKRVARPLLDFIYRIHPTSMDQALYYLPRYAILLLGAIAAIVGLSIWIF